jgi:hypothetical protein
MSKKYNTGFENYSLKQIIHEVNWLSDHSKSFLKSKKLLEAAPNEFDKSLYYDVYLLAERFIELYKNHDWKIRKEKVDEYLLENLKQLSQQASEYSSLLGKEKNSYRDYELFMKQEQFYNTCRQYCIDIHVVWQISDELEQRYFSDGKLLQISKKEPNIIFKGIQWIVKTIISKLPSF